ncbi:TPA: DUF4435 domain-containing protein [Aeromonas salmonicida]|nr:DUF4435 domain-containing protein [Aeromonas salmonicida]
MSDTKNYFTNRNYVKAYVTMESTEKDASGFIYIESESDREFWDSIIKKCAKGKYLFKFKGKQDGKSEPRGKSILEDLYTTANEAALVAIDSDFDYISPNRSDVSKKINSNKYVLQTYAYAIENIKLDYLRIDKCLGKICFFEPNEHRVSVFMKNYSSIIHQVLLKYLYLMNVGVQLPFLDDEFHKKIIPIDIVHCYSNNDLSSVEKLASEVDLVLSPLLDDMTSFSVFCDLSYYRGMNAENCYKFIKGHDVEDKIINPIVNYIRQSLIAKESARIKTAFEAREIEDRLKEVKGHFKEKCNFHTLINCIPHTEDDSIYNKICDHVRSINI